MEFVTRFAAGDVNGLATILGDPFHLKGPLFEFHSKQDYLDSLAADVLEEASSEVISLAEDIERGRVMVVYEYQKRDATIVIAQEFAISDQKIIDTTLAFDMGNAAAS